MSLNSGTRVGPYEITGALDAGGMGEVYRARDSRLARDVAVKIIPAGFAVDPDRLQRFEQETRAAAALSHPNILVVHDLGAYEGTPYIVTELLEGETLREQVSRGPMSVRMAVEYAVAIASGLAAAHEKGIVHRDLKPENVFVTLDGRVKILDFGLAKLTQVEVAGLGSALPTTPPLAPGRLETTPGVVLGTIGYMSPEQVRGVTADHRADIFALGTILYEMLTARRAFRGESTIETMAAILRDQPPDLAESDRPVSPALRRIVEHCIEKRPEMRFQSAQDVAFALEAISGGSDSRVGLEAAAQSTPAARSRAIGWKVATAVATVVAIVSVPFALSHWLEQSPVPLVARFSMDVPANTSLTMGGTVVSWFEVSPDGRHIAFRAASPDGTRLWIRSLDGVGVRPLTGRENIQTLFWSPDSRSVAFAADGVLKVVDIGGGAARTIVKLPQAIGASAPGVGDTWSADGTILLGSPSNGTAGSAIWRTSAGGAEFTPIAGLESAGSFRAYPVFLPDGRRFLFSQIGDHEPGLYLAAIDSAEITRLTTDYLQAEVANGLLFFTRGQSLMAQAFDADRGRVTGDPAIVVDGVVSNTATGRTGFSASANGVLVFTGGEVGVSQFTWFTRLGQPDGTVGTAESHSTMAISPDGRKLVYGRREPGGAFQSLWTTDLTRGVTTRLTFGVSRDSDGTWSPDSTRMAYASVRQGDKSLYEVPAAGGVERQILKAEGRQRSIDDWSPDGRFILYHMDAARELWAMPVGSAEKEFLVVKPRSGQVDEPTFSPDGKWVAYNSDESGRPEVYVVPFPPTGARWQVSSSGGMQAAWRQDGRELFFLAADGSLVAVDITLWATVELGMPHALFQTGLIPAATVDQYAASPDGKRFLIMKQVGEDPPPTVILDWPALLTNRN